MFTLLDIPLYSESKNRFHRIIDNWIKNKKKGYVCVTNIHGLTECFLHADVHDAHSQASYVVPDGMPLVWLGKILGYKTVERIYGPDLFWEINKLCVKRNYSIYLYGSTKSVIKKLIKNLHSQFPKLRIVGQFSPPFQPLNTRERHQIAQMINRRRPDILWVGLSTPKQELWMYEMMSLLQTPLLIGVGAAFDFAAGTKKQAPIWMRKISLEWLFRLIHEPGRLWCRYVQCIIVFPVLCISAIGAKFKKLFNTSTRLSP